jgi:hypothetical protein
MRRFRKYGPLLLALMMLIGSFGAGLSAAASDATPAATPTDSFSTPAVSPPPIQPIDVETCFGEECNGADPNVTKCDTGDVERQNTEGEPVLDGQGNLLGTLFLVGNHTDCGSTQWALFADLERPLTFELRVVQDETGVSTEWVRWDEQRINRWGRMLHSPELRVRAEVVVFDERGKEIARAHTDSY